MVNILLHKKVWPIFLVLTLLVAVGVVLFMSLEGWSFIEALYFTVSTMTTVGYGDLSPTNDASRLVATIYMVVMVPIIFVSLGVIADSVYTYRNKRS